MNNKAKTTAIALSCALLCSPVAFAGCSSANQGSSGVEVESSQAPLLEQHVSALMPDYSISDFVDRSTLIVVATVSGFSDPMLINPSNGAEPRYYTDAYLQVNEVVKGSPALNGTGALQVRYCGGSGQRMATIDDLAPSFSEGSKYLLFLYRITDGSDYNTEGSQYYAVTDGLGVWEESDEETFANRDGKSVSLDDLKDVVAATPMPASEDADAGVRSTNGMAFATVMSAEEAAAYEQSVVDGQSGSSGISSSSSS